MDLSEQTEIGISASSDCIFHTARLVVRNFAPDDWQVLQRLLGTPEVARMTASISAPWSESEAKAWMRRRPFRSESAAYSAGVYHAILGLIGMVGLGGKPLNLMYAFGQDYWGQGFASEVAHGALEHGFHDLGVRVLEASHFDDNPASARILSKLGFEKSGEEVGESLARLEPAPIITYRLTQQQFKATTHEIS